MLILEAYCNEVLLFVTALSEALLTNWKLHLCPDRKTQMSQMAPEQSMGSGSAYHLGWLFSIHNGVWSLFR
jgi:hypothetical protein